MSVRAVKRAQDKDKLKEGEKLRLQVEQLTEFKGRIMEAQVGWGGLQVEQLTEFKGRIMEAQVGWSGLQVELLTEFKGRIMEAQVGWLVLVVLCSLS